MADHTGLCTRIKYVTCVHTYNVINVYIYTHTARAHCMHDFPCGAFLGSPKRWLPQVKGTCFLGRPWSKDPCHSTESTKHTHLTADCRTLLEPCCFTATSGLGKRGHSPTGSSQLKAHKVHQVQNESRGPLLAFGDGLGAVPRGVEAQPWAQGAKAETRAPALCPRNRPRGPGAPARCPSWHPVDPAARQGQRAMHDKAVLVDTPINLTWMF